MIPSPLTLIDLNIWGGHVLEPLLDFIKAKASTHIFCFQEVYSKADKRISTDYDNPVYTDIHEQIKDILSSHADYFSPVVNGNYGLSMFIHKDIEVKNHGSHPIHENPYYPGKGPTHGRILQWLEIEFNQKTFTIINVHGLWNGKGKTDSPDRIAQSQAIRSFMSSCKNPVILCGDFNIRPETKSFQILSKDMQDWIKIKDIKSTRSSFYKKQEPFADYILTSPEIDVVDFKVLDDEVSDHLALRLEINEGIN